MPDIMRHKYRTLSTHEVEQIKKVKDMGLEFYQYLEIIGAGREISLAKTKIEEAVMWATKHISQ